MLTRKLLNIPVKMLRADLVEGSFVCSFKGSPKGFDSVSVSHTLNEFPDTVIYGLMIGKSGITLMVVGINLSVRGSVVSDKTLYGFFFPVGNPLGDNLVRLPVFHSD